LKTSFVSSSDFIASFPKSVVARARGMDHSAGACNTVSRWTSFPARMTVSPHLSPTLRRLRRI
jgi:hypothetical protein